MRRQLLNELRRQTYAIVFFHNQFNYARFVGVCEWRCAHVDPVITVRVLCLFHNNKSGYSWHAFIAETIYKLSNTKLLLLVVSWCSHWLVKWMFQIVCMSHTVLCKTLNMYLWQVSLACDSGSLIGHLAVTFGGGPNFNVANSMVPIWDLSYFSFPAFVPKCLWNHENSWIQLRVSFLFSDKIVRSWGGELGGVGKLFDWGWICNKMDCNNLYVSSSEEFCSFLLSR